MSSRKRNGIIAAVVVVVIVVIAIFSFGGFGSKKTTAKTVNIGIMTPTTVDKNIWNIVAKNAKDKYDITLKFTYFTDYTQPNKALTSGSIDLNAFQHYAFLAAWNKANKTDIVSIGNTWIQPINLYSDKYKSVKDLPNGAKIAIPNDSSNESRALYLLEGQGLIKLNVSGDTLASTSNVSSNPENLDIEPLAANNIAVALSSVDAAVINGNYAEAAKISKDKSIAEEPLNSNSAQWINFIAANKKDDNNQVYKDVVKSLQQANVEAAIKKGYSDGSELPAWNLSFAKDEKVY